jgi:peptidyl-prolyl cis-trans isomerase SurA
MRHVAAIAAAAGLIAAGFGESAAARQGQVIQKIIVKVNGEIFTQTELEQRQIEALREQNRQVSDPKALQTDAGLRAALATVTPEVLADAIEELLLVQRARDMGVEFTDKAFGEALDNVKKQNNLNDEQFKVALAQEGLTLEQLRQNFERQYMRSAVTQTEIYPRLQITDEELRQYYQAHPEEFALPETVMLREIFMAVPTTIRDNQPVVNVAEEEAIRGRMQAARERAVKGEDFAKLAAELSESPSKANGGLIGPVDVAQIAPAMRKLIDALKAGDIGEPVRTTRGFQMLKLESRSEAKPRPFGEVRQEILQKMRLERGDAELAKYLDGLLARAQIEWKDDSYRAAYQKLIEERAKRSGVPR